MTYVDGLLKTLLTDGLDPVPVSTLQPANLLQTIAPAGCLIAKHLPGGGAIDVRFSSTRATVQVDGYHPTKRGAYDLTHRAVGVLTEAWKRQTTTPDGVIAQIVSTAEPAELREDQQPTSFTRYTATLTLLCRFV